MRVIQALSPIRSVATHRVAASTALSDAPNPAQAYAYSPSNEAHAANVLSPSRASASVHVSLLEAMMSPLRLMQHRHGAITVDNGFGVEAVPFVMVKHHEPGDDGGRVIVPSGGCLVAVFFRT